MKHSIKMASVMMMMVMLFIACGKKPVEKQNIKIRPIGRFGRTFNDRNDAHLASAQKWGVPEIESREDAKKHRRQLKEIKSCDLYKVDSLTHSIPYLVPRAKDLLETIAQNFQDSLASQHVGSYQIVVTSVLRTNDDVKKLRRRNSNASANSAHRYGTTFDIAYARFNRTDNDYPYDITAPELKHLLSEVLRDLQHEQKCWVKYEVKQGCFHITVR